MNRKLLRILGKRGRITIPYEIRQRVGFEYNDVLSFTESEDGRSVIVRREKLCDNCQGQDYAGGVGRPRHADGTAGLPVHRAAKGGVCSAFGEAGKAAQT